MGESLMADQDNGNLAAGAGNAPENRWANHAKAALGLSSSLAIAGLLFGAFWMGRPYNLKPETQELAKRLESSLREHYVPPENVERGESEEKSETDGNKTTQWTFHPFRVTVPKRLNNNGLRKTLRQDMTALNVRVMNKERDPNEPEIDKLAFYLGKYEFAEMILLPSVEDVIATNRSVLRSSSTQLADITDKVLKGLNLSPAHTREDAVPREDLNSLWNYTHFTAQLPPGLTLGALKEKMEAMIALPDARVEVGNRLQGDVNMQITLGGRTCVGLACSVTPAAPPARPEPVNLDTAMEGGILGSEPEESMELVETSEPTEAPAIPDENAPVAAPVPVVESTVTQPEPQGSESKKIRLAIIIDDGGYVRADTYRVLKLDPRLTLAILPNTPHGKATAQEGSDLGFEIMLHMPMETHSTTEQAVEGTIYTAMGKKEIQKLTNNALNQYPAVVGINNHTGSKFTEKAKKLGYVFEVLEQRDLFFIDSYTKNTSVALETARKAGLPTARRDVFLDNDEDEASILAQFEVLVKTAIEEGSAIGIGHFQKPNTAKVLAEEIPKLKNAGIELVHVSELLQ